MSIENHLFLQNRHWEEPYSTPDFHRDLFPVLLNSVDNRFIVTLIGPRRVGKTTMLKQLINHLVLEKNVDPKTILYFSLDLFKSDLLSIYNAFIDYFGHPYRGKFILVFDEIQYLENWASHVKTIRDNLDCKIFVSGSSSTDLRRGIESLAGREIELFLKPLSFGEYLRLTQSNPQTEHARWNHYLRYMDHQLPEIAINGVSRREYIVQLVDKVINGDIARLHHVKDSTPIESLFRLICKSPGEIIIATDLAQELGLDRRTLQHYLNILEQALLIRKVFNYSGNPRKSERRHKRYYPFYTTLLAYTEPFPIEFGKKAETEVAFQLSAEYFWNDRGREIDFIVGDKLEKAVEVKMRNSINKKAVKTILNSHFPHKFLVTKLGAKIDQSIQDSLSIVPLHDVSKVMD